MRQTNNNASRRALEQRLQRRLRFLFRPFVGETERRRAGTAEPRDAQSRDLDNPPVRVDAADVLGRIVKIVVARYEDDRAGARFGHPGDHVADGLVVGAAAAPSVQAVPWGILADVADEQDDVGPMIAHELQAAGQPFALTVNIADQDDKNFAVPMGTD